MCRQNGSFCDENKRHVTIKNKYSKTPSLCQLMDEFMLNTDKSLTLKEAINLNHAEAGGQKGEVQVLSSEGGRPVFYSDRTKRKGSAAPPADSSPTAADATLSLLCQLAQRSKHKMNSKQREAHQQQL